MTLQNLKTAMWDAGVRRLFVKRLASNNNSKQQVYLGGGFRTLNFLPISEPTSSRTSHGTLFKASIDLKWLDETGLLAPAPHAQLILYPQYPEVRMSGFLLGCKRAPSSLMQKRDKAGEETEEYRRRVMFLGVTENGSVVGYVAAGGSTIETEVRQLPQDFEGVLQEISMDSHDIRDTRDLLVHRLSDIHHKGWIKSHRLLTDGTIGRCEAPNCGGYTLEAELGITPNGFSEPDFHGWEIKQFGVTNFDHLGGSRLTLMTPEPTGGIYKEEGVERFVRQFGYPDMKGRCDRLNFGGVHRAAMVCKKTGLMMILDGFDTERNRITDAAGGILLKTDRDVVAAKWHFSRLLKHWNRKHAQAAYIPSLSRRDPTRHYYYGSTIALGEGTDFELFLSALADGIVFYDPGIKVEESSSTHPKLKRRNQFRIASKNLYRLYQEFNFVDLPASTPIFARD